MSKTTPHASRVGIIGFSGKGKWGKFDGISYSNELYESLQEVVTESYIYPILSSTTDGDTHRRNGGVTLVSGGSSWADHVAVTTYLDSHDSVVSGLELYLPCEFDPVTCTFDSSSEGKTLNKYHSTFSKIAFGCPFQSRMDIAECTRIDSCTVVVRKGFFSRNSLVASRSTLLVGIVSGVVSNSRGTYDTWKKCKGRRVLVSSVTE